MRTQVDGNDSQDGRTQDGDRQRRMVELFTELDPPEGARPSRVPGVLLLKTTRPTPPIPVLYEPCIAVVAQGRKRFHLPDHVVSYDARNYLLLTVPAPADCETLVAKDGPFLGMVVRIDLAVLSDLALKLTAAQTFLHTDPRPACVPANHWVGAPPMTASLRDVAIRLLECMRSPLDAEVLGPGLVRELTYRVLSGEGGGALRELLAAQGVHAQIHRILHRMHTEFAAPLHIPSLAQEVAMSVSALHQHFKAVTATSPVQYLKTIRLHKARTLMVQDTVSAAAAAERVGYDSASQFSREFKRMFGAPPADEAQRVRTAIGLSA